MARVSYMSLMMAARIVLRKLQHEHHMQMDVAFDGCDAPQTPDAVAVVSVQFGEQQRCMAIDEFAEMSTPVVVELAGKLRTARWSYDVEPFPQYQERCRYTYEGVVLTAYVADKNAVFEVAYS